MKSNFVGNFSIGSRTVDLFIDSESDEANFSLRPRDSKAARITVGTQQPWGRVVHVLLHEAFEMISADLGLRFVPAPDYALDNGSYVIFMSHTQFSEVTARVGEFLADAIPDLQMAYKKRKK